MNCIFLKLYEEKKLYKSTLGIESSKWITNIPIAESSDVGEEENKRKLEVEILDFSGQIEYFPTLRFLLSGMHSVCIVSALFRRHPSTTDREIQASCSIRLRYWMSYLRPLFNLSNHFPVVLALTHNDCGNVNDVMDQCIKQSNARSFDPDIEAFPLSRTDSNLDQALEGAIEHRVKKHLGSARFPTCYLKAEDGVLKKCQELIQSQKLPILNSTELCEVLQDTHEDLRPSQENNASVERRMQRVIAYLIAFGAIFEFKSLSENKLYVLDIVRWFSTVLNAFVGNGNMNSAFLKRRSLNAYGVVSIDEIVSRHDLFFCYTDSEQRRLMEALEAIEFCYPMKDKSDVVTGYQFHCLLPRMTDDDRLKDWKSMCCDLRSDNAQDESKSFSGLRFQCRRDESDHILAGFFPFLYHQLCTYKNRLVVKLTGNVCFLRCGKGSLMIHLDPVTTHEPRFVDLISYRCPKFLSTLYEFCDRCLRQYTMLQLDRYALCMHCLSKFRPQCCRVNELKLNQSQTLADSLRKLKGESHFCGERPFKSLDFPTLSQKRSLECPSDTERSHKHRKIENPTIPSINRPCPAISSSRGLKRFNAGQLTSAPPPKKKFLPDTSPLQCCSSFCVCDNEACTYRSSLLHGRNSERRRTVECLEKKEQQKIGGRKLSLMDKRSLDRCGSFTRASPRCRSVVFKSTSDGYVYKIGPKPNSRQRDKKLFSITERKKRDEESGEWEVRTCAKEFILYMFSSTLVGSSPQLVGPSHQLLTTSLNPLPQEYITDQNLVHVSTSETPQMFPSPAKNANLPDYTQLPSQPTLTPPNTFDVPLRNDHMDRIDSPLNLNEQTFQEGGVFPFDLYNGNEAQND